MSAALAGLFLILVVVVAADVRVASALFCLFKSLTGKNPVLRTKEHPDD